MRTALFFLLLVTLAGCAVSDHPQRYIARQLQKGNIKEDTSFVYALPFEAGQTHLVVQAYFSRFSHRQRAAIDFKMRKGTKVVAARSGVVSRIREEGSRRGLKPEYRNDGNFVIIDHDDGTRAGYWHLKRNGVLVQPGDSIQQGQLIALSGNTGYSAFPHLHFTVWRHEGGRWIQIPTRFQAKKKARYLRPFRFYTKRKNKTAKP